MSLLRTLRAPTASSSSSTSNSLPQFITSFQSNPISSSSSSISPSLITRTSKSSFSTTSSQSESKSKRKSRLTKKAHIERKASLTRSELLTRPDPILGYAKGKESVWELSELKKVLLNRKEVWGQVVKVVPGETVGGSSTPGVGSSSSGEDVVAGSVGSPDYIPKYYNFGLNSNSVKLLSEVLPKVAAQRDCFDVLTGQQLQKERADKAETLEEEKKDRLMRIIDLRNASSKGIEVENVRRIVNLFGRKEGDTGSPEVQAAIMTSRIHSLSAHLLTSPRDIHNRRPLRSLIQQRAKILKYLKSKDVTRYQNCLEKIGVEARAVEGEVIVTKGEMRTMIKGA